MPIAVPRGAALKPAEGRGPSETHLPSSPPPGSLRASPGLRDAVRADRPAMLDLWVAAWGAAMPEIDFEARRPWLDRHLDDLLRASARLLVAESEGAPAGFVTVDPARGHLDQIAVHPRHQGRGIADHLMEGAKALSPGGLALDVNEANMRARRFYARHGFAPVGAGVNPRSGLPTLLLRWGGSGVDAHRGRRSPSGCR